MKRRGTIPISLMTNPVVRAGVLGDRVVLALRGQLLGVTHMGTLPLSTLVD